MKESAKLTPEDPFRVDILWSYLKNIKVPGSNECEFDVLFKVAEVVMTIPYSNAGEERIFSLINENKTPSRSSLSLDGTLSSLITVKTVLNVLWSGNFQQVYLRVLKRQLNFTMTSTGRSKIIFLPHLPCKVCSLTQSCTMYFGLCILSIYVIFSAC